MAGGAATAAISSDPGSLMMLINNNQVLRFLPLIDTNMPIMLKKVLSNLDSFNNITNIIQLMLHSDNFKYPYKRFDDFGFNTASFIYNAGKLITIITIISFIAALAVALGKCKYPWV